MKAFKALFYEKVHPACYFDIFLFCTISTFHFISFVMISSNYHFVLLNFDILISKKLQNN